MAENYSSLVASSTSDVHEVGVGSLDESFEFVLLLFGLEGGVKEISLHALDCATVNYYPKNIQKLIKNIFGSCLYNLALSFHRTFFSID